MSEIDLHDQILKHSLQLMRLSAGEQARVVEILTELEGELKQLVQASPLSATARGQVEDLIRQAETIISGSYSTASRSLDTRTLAIVVAQKTQAIMEDVIPAAIAMPTADTLASIGADVMIEGAPSSAWWARQSEDTAFRFAAQVRQGVVNGETNEKIVQRIVGKRGEPGIMEVSKRNARSLVQSSVMTSANRARLATFRANSRVIAGVRQLSTLDSHTSDICIAYFDATWDLDGHPIRGNKLPFNGGPPRHWGCRSVLVAIPKSFRDIGIDIDEPTEGQRASSLGPVPASTTFDAFLKRMSAAEQNDILGKGKAALWRAGKITLKDLVSGTGRPLTLAELQTA